VEKDRVRYRCATAIDRLFDNNAGRLGGLGKSNGIHMRGRRNDGNIDQIEVFDEHEQTWVPLPSTQPAYTHNLSFWEHEQYEAAAKHRREAFGSERARLESKTETRRLFEEMLPKAPFRRRAAMASLILSEQVNNLNGKPIQLPEGVEVTPQGVADFRTDVPHAVREKEAKDRSKWTSKDNRERPPTQDDASWDDAEFGEDEA
jgi:hypothetical protein